MDTICKGKNLRNKKYTICKSFSKEPNKKSMKSLMYKSPTKIDWKVGSERTIMTEKKKTEVKFETGTAENVGKIFSYRTPKEDDKKKESTTEDANEALSWLSLVDDEKKKDKNARNNKPKTRYQNRTSHRDKKGWDRFFCSL